MSAERLSTPIVLVGGGRSRCWRCADGLVVPKAGTALHRRWVRAFVALARRFFERPGHVFVRRRVAVSSLVPMNGVMNHARKNMYTRMARAERRLPPIVVLPWDDRFHVLDGNHRLRAAEDALLDALDALVLTTRRAHEGR